MYKKLGAKLFPYNPIALGKAKIACNFGLSECSRVKSRCHFGRVLSSREASKSHKSCFPVKMAEKHGIQNKILQNEETFIKTGRTIFLQLRDRSVSFKNNHKYIIQSCIIQQ